MTVATMQNFLREDDEDSFSKKAFIFGKSTHNQVLLLLICIVKPK